MSRDDRDGGPLWLYRRILLAGLPGIVAAPMLGACGSLFPERGSLRFRVVVEVDSPSGLKAGASVLENRNQAGASGAMRRLQNPRAECFGEAVVVDLGEGRALFAVREDAYGGRRMYEMVQRMLAYPEGDLHPPLPSRPSRGDWPVAYREARNVEPSARIHRSDYPLLVAFRDRRNPSTAVEVPPDMLAAVFGGGHALRRILVQVTADPMTEGVVARWLPWLMPLDQPVGPLRSLDKAANPMAFLGKHVFKYMGN